MISLTKSHFLRPLLGIYWIMANVRLDQAGGNYFRLAVGLNGRTPDINGGLHSVTGLPSGSYYTLHVAGALQLNKGNTVSLWVYSNSDTDYYIQSETTFSVQYLGVPGRIPAFLAAARALITRRGVGTYQANLWNTKFTSMSGFSTSSGYYTVPVDGIYLVSTNLRLDGADSGIHRVAIALNGKLDTTTGLTAVKSGALHKRYQTVNVFGAVSLTKGTTLSVWAQATTDKSWTIYSESGFSAAYVGPIGQVRGVHARRYFTWATTRRNTWYELWQWRTYGSQGLFQDNYYSPVTGRYTTQAPGE